MATSSPLRGCNGNCWGPGARRLMAQARRATHAAARPGGLVEGQRGEVMATAGRAMGGRIMPHEEIC